MDDEDRRGRGVVIAHRGSGGAAAGLAALVMGLLFAAPERAPRFHPQQEPKFPDHAAGYDTKKRRFAAEPSPDVGKARARKFRHNRRG